MKNTLAFVVGFVAAFSSVTLACVEPPDDNDLPPGAKKHAALEPSTPILYERITSSPFYAHFAFTTPVWDAGATDAAAPSGWDDVDLLAASTNPPAGQPGSACRLIVPDSAGNLTVLRASDGAQVTLVVGAAGVGEPIQATRVIAALTTVTGAKIYW